MPVRRASACASSWPPDRKSESNQDPTLHQAYTVEVRRLGAYLIGGIDRVMAGRVESLTKRTFSVWPPAGDGGQIYGLLRFSVRLGGGRFARDELLS